MLASSSATSSLLRSLECNWRRVGAVAVDPAGSLSVVVSVVSVVLVVVVIGIGVVVVSIVWKVCWSCNKLAWMLAFNTSKLMHCGGGVMGR